MIAEYRKAFNEAFTTDKYQSFLSELHSKFPGAIDFRIGETPVFVPDDFARKMIDACESIVDIITEKSFLEVTERSIPANERVPGEEGPSHMIAFDFGVCFDEEGNLEPQLIEMQGFPTLYGFQVMYPEIINHHFPIPSNYSQYLNGYNKDTYLKLLKDVIVGDELPESVILLEIKPHEQKTRIDFYATEHYLGIKPVCLSELIKEGNKLFYLNNGVKTQVKRIYNRVIFDELNTKTDFNSAVDIREPLDVKWIPHPNWFYRISKFTLPMIHHPNVPETFFLNDVKQLPSDLHNYVLKPLFSFAGQGVIIDINEQDVNNIPDPENWILQRKVVYAPIIETPDEPAKAEIRVMYLWKEGDSRPKAVINLARLSKGKMIGVRYNKDKEWVGGSVGLFKQKS